MSREKIVSVSKSDLLNFIMAAHLDERQLDELKQIAVQSVVLKDIRDQERNPPLVITVPDLPLRDLLAAVEEMAGPFDDLDRGSWERNFTIGDARGKVYEVAVWHPGRQVTRDHVRRFFRAFGGDRPFRGNTAAFLAFVAIFRPDGFFTTVLSTQAAPSFTRLRCGEGKMPNGRSVSSLRLTSNLNVFYGIEHFVAFREFSR